MILPFDYIGYKRLSENKRFPNHRWYSDTTWGEMGEGSPLPPMTIINVCNLFAPIVGPLIGIINILILILTNIKKTCVDQSQSD